MRIRNFIMAIGFVGTAALVGGCRTHTTYVEPAPRTSLEEHQLEEHQAMERHQLAEHQEAEQRRLAEREY